ncbi:MAG: peptidyl-prolyl cis-trans isomerase [Candidatus Omnitrophica bacterium]|nr:peptidyl-prolyl cis-trans isomerase [Candidatus Omnitrophota bacterium]
MEHLIKILTIVVALIFTLNPPARAEEPQETASDAVIAVVNDEVITFKDLQDYIHQTYVSLVAQGMSEGEIKDIMADFESSGLKKLIEDKLILSRANEVGIEVRDKLVEQRMAEIQAKYSSEQVFLDALVKNGATVTDLRDKILEQLKIKFVVEHEVKSKVFVNPQEVTEFYDGHKDSFQKPRRMNLDSIYITFLEDKGAARQRADEAAGLIKGGKDFEEVAKQYSDTPSIGIVEEGQMIPEVEKVVFGLSEGEVTGPVETEKGIYIFRLKGKIPAQVADLKEVKARIYEVLFRKKFQERFDQWLDKLKKKAYVEIKP